MFRRNDGARTTGYGYEKNLEKAIYKCKRYYKGNVELIKACCDYYQVDYYEVMQIINHEENEK